MLVCLTYQAPPRHSTVHWKMGYKPGAGGLLTAGRRICLICTKHASRVGVAELCAPDGFSCCLPRQGRSPAARPAPTMGSTEAVREEGYNELRRAALHDYLYTYRLLTCRELLCSSSLPPLVASSPPPAPAPVWTCATPSSTVLRNSLARSAS